MAVYKRGYEPYTGPVTPERARFLIIARYAYRSVFDSKFMIVFFIACLIGPLVFAAMIYAPHNAWIIAISRGHRLFTPGPQTFLRFFAWQCTLAFMLAGILGPGLVSPDLTNNALPLFFSRPFSRAEYVVGKISVIAILASAITWIPGLLLFAWAGYLEGWQWCFDNNRVATGMFIGAWVWIIVLCMIAMAMSAWVRWRIAAGALIFGLFFISAGVGQAINEATGGHPGNYVNLFASIQAVWETLFGLPVSNHIGVGAFVSLAAVCGICYWLLAKKLRAYHVERA